MADPKDTAETPKKGTRKVTAETTPVEGGLEAAPETQADLPTLPKAITDDGFDLPLARPTTPVSSLEPKKVKISHPDHHSSVFLVTMVTHRDEAIMVGKAFFGIGKNMGKDLSISLAGDEVELTKWDDDPRLEKKEG